MLLFPMTLQAAADDDPYRWLEDVHGERALAWVRQRNLESQKALAEAPDFASLQTHLLDVLNAADRIPAITRRGPWLYNFWQDATHPRGVWRRATLESYRQADTDWDTVLDVDALGREENENWTWGGANCLAPAYRQCLLSLSRGGADAKVVREFDTVAKRFVKDGFTLPEAKSTLAWIDENTVYVATDFGPGSLTDSGYPRIVKRWKRGVPLSESATVFEGERSDVAVSVWMDPTPGYERTVFRRALDFFRGHHFVLLGGKLVKLQLPDDASITFMRDTLLMRTRSEFEAGGQRFAAGSLLQTDAAAYLRGERKMQALFTPTGTRSLAGFVLTRHHVIVDVMDNVASRLEQWHKRGANFERSDIPAPFPGSLGIASLHDPSISDDPLADRYLVSYTDFLTPDSLLLATAGRSEREALKARRPLFDASGMRAEQRFATSKDGTRVPYFVVWPRGARADGRNPTLLYGYGGFEISMTPWYSGGFGRAWFERGGVLVVANIRGGGEYGPAWHQAALKQHRQRAFDDFIAVAEDLIQHKITSPRHLGIEGGSNGGLLVGAVMVQQPELFNAVVCQVPLLDMRRYHQLLAGASWMAEYGNPDLPEEWAWIAPYSPYQNVREDASYPKVLFTTSTRDDRVHPGHARKMAARMLAQGHAVHYYENIEGGHGGAADNQQRAYLQALEFIYLWQQLAGEAAAP